MVLWTIFAVLTALALAVVVRPLFASDNAAPHPSAAPDLAVYRDQLAELERQRAQGRLDPSEYDALHHEVARRILRVGASSALAGAPAAIAGGARFASTAILLFVSVGALTLYINLGAPGVSGRPFGSSPNAQGSATAADLIAKVEARLAAAPEDGRGWDAIAPVYLRLERFDDAARAYRRASELLGETPQRLAGFAEATVAAHDGIVTEPARLAYERLAALAPDRFEPRFWLALAKEQDGKRDAAAADYRALLAAAPADAPWRSLVEQRLSLVTDQPPGGTAGPSDADITASASMTADERAAMIAGMVDKLAVRLRANGGDVEGWQRLVMSYMALKQPDRARAALAEARIALAGVAAATPALDTLAKRLGGTP